MSQTALSVHLRPSPVLAALILAVHVLAGLALSVSLEGPALALALTGVGLSALRAAGDALRRWPDSALAIELHEDGRAAWQDRRERWHEAAIGGGGYASPWLIIVPLAAPAHARKWIVVGPGAASEADRRSLRSWLLWRRAKNGHANR